MAYSLCTVCPNWWRICWHTTQNQKPKTTTNNNQQQLKTTNQVFIQKPIPGDQILRQLQKIKIYSLVQDQSKILFILQLLGEFILGERVWGSDLTILHLQSLRHSDTSLWGSVRLLGIWEFEPIRNIFNVFVFEGFLDISRFFTLRELIISLE